ncbi:MAG: hypothetical protein NZ555_14035, partial [Geminicoccaceae bacterium]|nr:hypothetical protein [Geminicoccaceae bacterium]
MSIGLFAATVGCVALLATDALANTRNSARGTVGVVNRTAGVSGRTVALTNRMVPASPVVIKVNKSWAK